MMAAKEKGWKPLVLDEANCLVLADILKSFSNPITEQHAWAIIHQAMKCLCEVCGDETSPKPYGPRTYGPKTPESILINKNGDVHSNTFTKSGDGRDAGGPNFCIADLGVAIYEALEYGEVEDGEERELSTELENLLDFMVAADNQNSDDDEGIETTEDDLDLDSAKEVVSLCRHHLAVEREADEHYRGVCRALVNEAMELNSFMYRVSSVSKAERDLQEELQGIALGEWCSLWSSVMNQLRTGIKLKKVEYTRTPNEFAMTPYEMLMGDIKSKKYHLNHVEKLNASVRRDARDVILEYIRSRPPLRPALTRQLKPLRKESTPVETLMDDLRGTRARQSLRKTKVKAIRAKDASKTSKPCIEEEKAPKKVIDLDESMLKDMLDFDDSPNDDNQSNTSQEDVVFEPKTTTPNSSTATPTSSKATPTSSTATPCSSTIKKQPKKLSANDRRKVSSSRLGSQTSTPRVTSSGRLTVASGKLTDSSGRLTVASGTKTVRKVSGTAAGTPRVIAGTPSPMAIAGTHRTTQLKKEDRTPCPCPPTRQKDDFRLYLASASDRNSEFIQRCQDIDLTIQELSRIRDSMTRAELEDRNLEKTVSKDLEKGRVCFVCEKIRFGVFCWSTSCSICKKYVCSKCTTRMRLPSDNFKDIPVSILTNQMCTSDHLEPEEQSLGQRLSASFGLSGGVSPSTPSTPSVFTPVRPAPATAPPPLYRQQTSPDLKQQIQDTSTPFRSGLSRVGWGRSSLRKGPTALPSPSTTATATATPSTRPRPVLVRSKTMGKSDVERLKAMKLNQPGSMHPICTSCRDILTSIVRLKMESEKLSKVKSRLASFREES